MKILIIIGTRPNFIKVTQFKKIADSIGKIEIEIAHTGQHYDQKMSGIFFDQFSMAPDYFLTLTGETAAEQFGQMISDLGSLMTQIKPDAVIVPGDVNSTLAGALAANRCGIPVFHLESGLRSFDRSMPEEINRVLVDQISDRYFVTEQSGLDNLQKEGLDKRDGESVTHLFGNTMIDTLVAFDDQIQTNSIVGDLHLEVGEFALLTMHRPSNVDNVQGLKFLLDLIEELAHTQQVVFPVHPRTKTRCSELGMWDQFGTITNLIVTEPLDYFSFQKLISSASVVITDSGGIQEETTFRQVPCITIRPNTERPSTIELGTNHLVPRDFELVMAAIRNPKSGSIPPFWDGKTTERILHLISGL